MSVLIAGAWRNGLSLDTKGYVGAMEKRRHGGFKALPAEKTIRDLIDLLDGYDTLIATLLVAEELSEHSPQLASKTTT